MFVIEDEIHAELCGEFTTFNDTLMELRFRSTIPWDSKPNVCPCTSWKTCSRDYIIVEYDNSQLPWKEIKRTPVLEVSAKGPIWDEKFKERLS